MCVTYQFHYPLCGHKINSHPNYCIFKWRQMHRVCEKWRLEPTEADDPYCSKACRDRAAAEQQEQKWHEEELRNRGRRM